jgi:serine O-acetyltransferase
MSDIWKFERLLRKTEYYYNCKKSFFWMPYILYLRFKLKKANIRLGYSIPLNVFGPGLSIAHTGTLIVNGNAKVGKNCRIHNCVHIGTEAGANKNPIIGDNVFIGPGSQIFGGIIIADGIAIGANSVVNKSFTEPGITIAGAPARKISDKGSKYLYFRATDIIDDTIP